MGSRKLGIIFLASVVLAFFAGYYIQQVMPTTPTGTNQDTFEQITTQFKNYYYYDITDTQTQDAFIASMEATIKAYGEANNDPYTRLSANPLSVSPTGDESFVGIGISFLMEDLNLRVTYIYSNGAAIGKLYPNDLIVGVIVDSESIYFNTLDSETEVMNYLSGELDDTKNFIVIDPDLNEYTVDITYQEILTPTAYSLDMPFDDLAYIKITEFSGYVPDVTIGTSKAFNDTLNVLEADILSIDSESKTLIIDLRDNPGGVLTALHNLNDTTQIPGIIQQLLTKNVEQSIFQMIPRTGESRTFFGGLNQAKDYEIVALVNGHSASAAEVLAAALNTYGGYELYGQPTYGKGVYQNSINLLDLNNIRYALVYTEGEWFYDNGKNVATDPLAVNLIEQKDIHALDMPVYGGEVLLNQVSTYLSSYQAFFNYYFAYSSLNMLRTDGYLDSATQSSITDFQNDQTITVTGHLDRETAIAIQEIYMYRMLDITYDFQLQELIDLLES